jgi:hypothetical protein
MTNLSEGRRRGRPDMTHLFLLTALESIANKQGTVKLIIHTRNDEMITVHPETRIMRNYERFLGLGITGTFWVYTALTLASLLLTIFMLSKKTSREERQK